MSTSLEVLSGELVAKRLFDVAFAIDLTQVERLWTARTGASLQRKKLSSTPPKAVAFDVPPVVLELEAVALLVDGKPTTMRASARVYDFGVVSLALHLPVSNLPWLGFVSLANSVDQAIGAQALSPIWPRLLDQVLAITQAASTRPLVSELQEDYLYASVRSFDAAIKADELQKAVDLIPLLSGESRPLSEGTQRDLLRNRFSYYDDDLVVLTWDRAFIYDPRGDTDVADVLEIANAQLLEMRYYDDLLDDELPRMYDLVESTRKAIWPIAPGRYAKLAHRLYGLVAEVTELKEKVDNALQVTEDVYLARIYSSALDQFRVPSVSEAVDRKLSIIRDTYIALYDESSSRRAEILEVTIVLLILVELILALLH